jgi:hypothetical protein
MMKIVSYGGGVQSTGLLVLAAQGKIDYRTFLFCNVGDDSEHPATLAYVHDVAMPYAKEHGIELIELHKTRFGEPETLYQRLTRPGSRSIGIPVRMNSGAPGNRACTADFKIKVVDKWLKENSQIRAMEQSKEGALLYAENTEHAKKIHRFYAPDEIIAQVGIGISLDEFQRMKPNMDPDTMKWKENKFPLIEMRMDRQDCMNIIQDAGMPIPPKSSCFFCPFHTMGKWQDMRTNEPELFQKSVELETMMNERRKILGKDKVWFSGKLKPLEKATTDLEQGSLFGEDVGCDSGYCFL